MAGETGKEVLFVEGGRHASPIPEAVKAGPFVFLSAVRGVNPATERVDAEDIEVQTRQLFENMRDVLAAAGCGFEDVVKVAVFMTNLDERTVFNKVWSEHFPVDPPARFAVQIDDLGVPGDATRVLCDVTALRRA